MASTTFTNTPDANPIARVAALHGEAFAKGKDGSLRPLHLGDPIFASDVLVTADGARVVGRAWQAASHAVRGFAGRGDKEPGAAGATP